jgi:hypothetical protein
LQALWKRLDAEYGMRDYEKAEEVLRKFETMRRGHGVSMTEYIQNMIAARRRVKRIDPGSRLSDISFARRVLRSSGLRKEEQRQMLAAAGATWDVQRMDLLSSTHDIR